GDDARSAGGGMSAPRRIALLAAVLAALAAPMAFAQHQGHAGHGGHAGHQAERPSRDADHAGHERHERHEGHDEHEGHEVHEGHAAPRRAGTADDALPRTPSPELTDADRAAAFPPLSGHHAHGERIIAMLQFDRLEATDGDHGSGLAWEARAWAGNDWHRLWLRSSGERAGGSTEAADVELLYGRPLARWWDLLAGLRHDIAPGGSRDWAALGVMGVARQHFEVEATVYRGESGDLAARFEAEYALLITNRLVLQPVLEIELHGQADPGC